MSTKKASPREDLGQSKGHNKVLEAVKNLPHDTTEPGTCQAGVQRESLSEDNDGLLQAALDLYDKGLAIVPIHREGYEYQSKGQPKKATGKGPIVPGWSRRRLTRKELTKRLADPDVVGIGFVSGTLSDNRAVLDFDGKGWAGVFNHFMASWPELESTPTVETGSGKRHLHVHIPDLPLDFTTYKFEREDLDAVIELRGNASNNLLPPSLHPSGGRYQWLTNDDDPIEVSFAGLVTWLEDWSGESITTETTPNGEPSRGVITRLGRDALDFVANGAPVETQRSRALSAARNYLAAGYSIEDTTEKIWQGLQNSPIGEPENPWTYKHAKNIVTDLANSPPKPLKQPAHDRSKNTMQIEKLKLMTTTIQRDGERIPLLDIAHRTDWGNAQRLAIRHGSNLRYCYPWSKWLVWDGQRWKRDNTGEVDRRAKEVIRELWIEAPRARDMDEHFKWAAQSESTPRLNAMIRSAQSEPGIPVLPEHLDTNPWKLNVLNGTLDLKTGGLRPHDRRDLITKVAPVVFDPEATCPLWLQFLEEIMDGDENMIGFLQRAIGYALTGDTSERVFFILYGRGANGKTTFLEVIRYVLGDYAQSTPTKTLLWKRSEAIPNDIARLRGARFVTGSETPQGRRLDETTVKALVGGDTVCARFLNQEFFDFKPECKIFLATNHKPIVKESANAIWDRLRLAPFSVTIPEEEQDKHLADKLKAEASGILNWALQGCLDLQSQGLGAPEKVRKATSTYREEMDEVGSYLTERCVDKPGLRVGATPLFKDYKDWGGALSRTSFGTIMGDKGYERRRSGPKGRVEYHGVGLSTEQLNGTE